MRTPEQIRDYQKKWREAHKEYIKQYNSVYGPIWYQKNRDRLRPIRKTWEMANTEKRASYSRVWRSKPENQVTARASSRCYKEKYPELVSLGLKKHRQLPLTRYKTTFSGAKRRNLDFDISFELFSRLIESDCTYCGSGFGYIGVDRIDNAKGYLVDNVCSCCTMCNMMKKTLSKQQFIEHAQRIATFNNI